MEALNAGRQTITIPHQASHSIIHIIVLKMKLNEIEKHTHTLQCTHTHLAQFGLTGASAWLQNNVSISD